ncbi:MAG: Mov34/MPN/PAD-1 family protein [Hylemonella sp.]|nr:Mov34/MPN/PAD-1 family protein [Hylemonella sp.]MDP1936431.1 Mov34/MPN/PAD-1 family protein [Hylemonella sp.]
MQAPPQAIADAVSEIARHSSVRAVGELREENGYFHVPVDFAVNLPSRAAAGVSATGVRQVEQIFFYFPPRYPLAGPVLYLRADFPADLPHINPHKTGRLVPPCVYQGSLNDLLHTAGFEAIMDQAVSWLECAASGQLMNRQQGWEPTRRGDSHTAFQFDADQMVTDLSQDGALVVVPARFVRLEDEVLLSLMQGKTDPQEFKSTLDRLGREGRTPFFSGDTPVLVATAAWCDGSPVIFDTYRADTVTDLESLASRAGELGIDSVALLDKIQSVLDRSIFVASNASKWPWPGDFLIGVVLAVKRPVHLIGSKRDIEFIPYLVWLPCDPAGPNLSKARVLPAFHVHSFSAKLLARTSGHPDADINQQITLLGCGSLGSKIGLHLGRAGFGRQTVADNEALVPHNLARHALIGVGPPNKALQLAVALMALGHTETEAAPVDIVQCLQGDAAAFSQLVPEKARLIIDTTASPQVGSAVTYTPHLEGHPGRLSRALLYNRGQAAVLLLEGRGRQPRCDDLLAELFRLCRHDPQLRAAIKGTSADLTEVFVGDNCRSITMPMSDSVVSRGAAAVSMQLERWLVRGFPEVGQVAVGFSAADEIGLNWHTFAVGPTSVLSASGDGGWSVRVSERVTTAITTDATHWAPRETGGALLGHIDAIGRTITIADLVPAPLDSVREETRFVLGTAGLQEALFNAHADSMGYLHYIGTWHSHPMGGPHSPLDRETLSAIAGFAPGLPIVSLVWKPDGLVCEVDRRR